MRRWLPGRVGVLAAPVLLLAGCTGYGSMGGSGYGPTGAAPVGRSGVVVATGHGWTSSGLEGPMPAPGSCHIRKAANGEPLPDPACTPGAVDPAVTNGDIRTTICRRGGYTSSVRPPVTLTDAAKRKLMAAYGIPLSQMRNYELDHLVDLAAGGASDVRNLWPEPNITREYAASSYVHNDKDAVESYTRTAICDGKVTVTAVQAAIASDWTTAVSKLGLAPMPMGRG